MRILHLSDPHLGKRRQPAPIQVWHRWLARVDELACDLIVVSGDLVDLPDDRARLQRVADDLEATGRPWLVVPGNHDIATPGGPSPFYEIFGDYPRVERHGEAAFVLFDSMGGLPVSARSQEERQDARGAGFYSEGAIGEAQLAAAARALEGVQATHRIAVVHHHLFWDDDPHKAQPMVPLHDTDALLTFCREHDIRMVLHGHRHPYAPPTRLDDLVVLRGPACTKPDHPAWLIELGGEVRLTQLSPLA